MVISFDVALPIIAGRDKPTFFVSPSAPCIHKFRDLGHQEAGISGLEEFHAEPEFASGK